MNGHQIMARAVRNAGVDTTFGLLGNGNMDFVISFERECGGKFVPSVDEGAAVSAADGYARIGRRAGVVSVTHGPAYLNTLNALTEAVRAHTPLLLITGSTPPTRGNLQEIDLHVVTLGTGAEYREVLATDHIADDIASALVYTLAAKVPVVLNIPARLRSAEGEYDPGPVPSGRAQAPGPDEHALDAALGIAASARRPIILAGRGAALAQAREDLVELSAVLGAPLATTLLAKDLFRGHPLNLGIAGTLAHSVLIDTFAEADCVFAFGAGLNKYTTNMRSLLSEKIVVRCDLSPTALHDNDLVSVHVQGDVRATASAMTDALRSAGEKGRVCWSTDLPERLKHARAETFAPGRAGFVDMREAMVAVDKALPEDRVVITDSGRFMSAPWKYLSVSDPLSFSHTAHFGSIGLGLSTSIGAALARPEAPTVVVIGDGGGLMGIVELATVARQQIPLLVVVLNDSCYGSEYALLQNAGEDPNPSLLPDTNFSEIAEGFGVRGHLARSVGELKAALDSYRVDGGPTLIDVKCDPTVDITL